MKYLKRFNEDINDNFDFEYDWDYIDDKLQEEHGWGSSMSLYHQEDFEKSDYFTNSHDDDTTVEEFNAYLTAIQFGHLDEEE